MKKCIVWMSVLCLLGICTIGLAADIDGKWESESAGRQGQGPSITTYTFKAEGSKLTGTVSGRGGDMEITEGKIEGNAFSFTVVRDINGNQVKQNYKGTISGDELKMTMEREGGFGGFGGGAPGGAAPGGAPPGGGMGAPGGGPGGGMGGGPRGPREIVAKRVN